MLLLGTESIDGFLQELAVLAARELGEGLSFAITLQPNGRPLTAANPTSTLPRSTSCSTAWITGRA